MTSAREIQSAADAASATVAIGRLGRQPYEPVRAAMIAFTNARDPATSDAIWLVEHPPVYTLGLAGRLEHLHGAGDVPVVRTERGGQVTYHGPGQLVGYLLVDLKRRAIKVRTFVRLIEDAIVATLAAYNLQGIVRPGAPGVYVEHAGEEKKIAALGLKIVNGRSFHGASLNVAMDLRPYDAIDACGYPGLKSIDLASLGVATSLDDAGDRFAGHFIERLDDASR